MVIHAYILLTSIIIPAIMSWLELLKVETAFVFAIVLFFIIEVFRLLWLHFLSPALENRPQTSIIYKCTPIKDLQPDPCKEKKRRLEILNDEVNSLYEEFRKQAYVLADRMGALRFGGPEIIKASQPYRSELIEFLITGIQYLVKKTIFDLLTRNEQNVEYSKDRSSLFMGMFIAQLTRHKDLLDREVELESTSERDILDYNGNKSNNKGKLTKAFIISWFFRVHRRLCDYPTMMKIQKEIYIQQTEDLRYLFPRWTTEDSCTFPFEFFLYAMINGLYEDTLEDLTLGERVEMISIVTKMSPAYAVEDRRTNRTVVGWSFIHEFVHVVTPETLHAFPVMKESIAGMFWGLNSFDGSRILYRDFLSPGIEESPMFILLAKGMNPGLIRYSESGHKMIEVWKEVKDTRIFQFPYSYGLLEFIQANRSLLESSKLAGAWNNVAIRPEFSGINDIDKYTVPVECLVNTFEEPTPEQLARGGMLRPLICEAACLSLWYLNGWLDWFINGEIIPANPSNKDNTNCDSSSTSFQQIVKTILTTSPDQNTFERYMLTFLNQVCEAAKAHVAGVYSQSIILSTFGNTIRESSSSRYYRKAEDIYNEKKKELNI